MESILPAPHQLLLSLMSMGLPICSEKKEQVFFSNRRCSIISSANKMSCSSNFKSSPSCHTFSKTQLILTSCIPRANKWSTLSRMYGISGELIVTFVAAPGNWLSHKGILRTTSSYEPLSVWEEFFQIRFRSCFRRVPSIVMPMERCFLFFSIKSCTCLLS